MSFTNWKLTWKIQYPTDGLQQCELLDSNKLLINFSQTVKFGMLELIENVEKRILL